MAKRKKRRLSPRFYMFAVLVFAGFVGILLITQKLKEPAADDPDATPTPVPTMTPAPTATPKPPLPAEVTVVRAESANPGSFGFSTELMVDGDRTTTFSRKDAVSFGRGGEYSDIPGILTFGSNNYRDTFTYGVASVTERRLKKVWEQSVGALGTWTGTGWTGQPLIVQWPDATRAVLGISDAFKQDEAFVEVIYPAMDGQIYFFDLNGKKTRNPINTGVVNKGTACLDPRGYPLLFVGQGIPVANEAGNGQSYVRVFNLLTNELLASFGGYDYFALRDWQAYDSSPMIANDTLIYAGENGVLYSSKLNAAFDAATGELTFEPERLVKYSYTGSGYSKSDTPGARWYGVESSVAAFRNFAFFTDNGGRLQCVNLNNLKLMYVTDVVDESDATPVIEESYDDNTIYLYAGTQASKSDSSLETGYGYSYLRKINGLTGAIVWERKWICATGDATASGGTVATPHVGRGNIANLVIFSVSQTALTVKQEGAAASSETPAPEAGAEDTPTATPEPVYNDGSGYKLGGRIVAYSKATGDIAWTVEQEDDYWSSPVVVYDEFYRGYLVQCDRGGHMKLYDASNGEFLYDLDLGSRIDSTPAVFGDMIIVGTRGKGGSGASPKIVGVKIF